MNDIGNISDFLYPILYADDTSVLLNEKYYAHLIGLLNTELETVSIWLKANKLSLNVKKTSIGLHPLLRSRSQQEPMAQTLCHSSYTSYVP